MLLKEFCCFLSNEQVRISVLRCSHHLSSSLSYLSPPSSVSTERELPFPSVAFGVLFALFVAGGSVATAERRLALMEEME
jgi:hypothetical protein